MEGEERGREGERGDTMRVIGPGKNKRAKYI